MSFSPPTVDDFLSGFKRECPPIVRRSELRKLGFPIAPGTLANYAAQRQGPPVFKVSGRACYRRDDLVDFLRQRTTAPATLSKRTL